MSELGLVGRERAGRKGILLTCSGCEKEFIRLRNRIKSRVCYCSVKCRGKSKVTPRGEVKIYNHGKAIFTFKFNGRPELKKLIERFKDYERGVIFSNI